MKKISKTFLDKINQKQNNKTDVIKNIKYLKRNALHKAKNNFRKF